MENKCIGFNSAACCHLSSNQKLTIYDFGDHEYLVFEGADRLRTEFRMICHSIYHAKDERNDNLPMLPLILLPEQVQVLFENGFAQIQRIKYPELGYSNNLSQFAESERSQSHIDDKCRLRILAQKILVGRQLKAQKRALYGPNCSSHSLKIRKLDHQKYATENQQQICATNESMINADEGKIGEIDADDELEQTVRELQMRDLQMQKQASCMILNYGLTSGSDYEISTMPPKFAGNDHYYTRLIVFRDLWRKGFYLTNGIKFGCDYLAYEKQPGELHSRFMVVCTDVNTSIQPLSLIAVSRVSTQVKKHILLAIVSPGVLIPYYMEINWWKGDR